MTQTPLAHLLRKHRKGRISIHECKMWYQSFVFGSRTRSSETLESGKMLLRGEIVLHGKALKNISAWITVGQRQLIVLIYGILAKTKVVIGCDASRMHRFQLWHRFIQQQMHVFDSFFSCVTKAESMFHFKLLIVYHNEGHKIHSCINEKKKGGRGPEWYSVPMPVFNQSFVLDMAQSEESDRKGARLSKVDGDFLAKIRIESVPAATKTWNNFELSSCLETTCQNRASTLS